MGMNLTRAERSDGRPWLMVLVLGFVFLMIAGFVAPACGDGGADTTSTTLSSTSSSAVGGPGAQISMQDTSYVPDTVTIKVGETATWTNAESLHHTVVADNGEFESNEIANGESFSFTFTEAGTYPFHCSIHPTMTGTVVVE